MMRMQYLMHIYVFGVSIYRMLILQLKIFHFDFLCNLTFISHFNAVAVCIMQMFTGFTATTRLSDVRLLLKIGY